MTGEKHHDTSANWLYFFFVCFGIIMLGIVFLFARDVNQETTKPSPSGHSMILPGERESHRAFVG